MYNLDKSLEEPGNIDRRINRSANWFFGLAILSVTNTLLLMLPGTTLIIGFGITALTYASTMGKGTLAILFMSLVTLAVTALFIILGICGRRKHRWAFVTGLTVYAIDGLLLILVQDWYSIAFHFALFILILQGLNATNLHNKP